MKTKFKKCCQLLMNLKCIDAAPIAGPILHEGNEGDCLLHTPCQFHCLGALEMLQ